MTTPLAQAFNKVQVEAQKVGDRREISAKDLDKPSGRYREESWMAMQMSIALDRHGLVYVPDSMRMRWVLEASAIGFPIPKGLTRADMEHAVMSVKDDPYHGLVVALPTIIDAKDYLNG